MRFVIYGAGAIGGAIGGRLHEAGHDVVLVARGEHLQAIRERGLTLRSPERTVTLPVAAVGHPSEADLRPGDVVVLAMKSQHTQHAVGELASVAPEGVAVACAQNGVANERMALRAFADVYGVTVMMPATHLSPGVVDAWSAPVTGLLDIGRYPTGIDATAETVAAAFEGASFSSEARPDVMRWKYRKLVLNLGNALEAIAGPAARGGPLHDRAAAEADAVFAAAGIDPVTTEQDEGRRGDLLRMRPIGDERWEGGSSWQSLTRGAGSIETDFLNGEIALLGRLHGVPTPVNALLQRLARQAVTAGHTPGHLSPDDLLAMLPA